MDAKTDLKLMYDSLEWELAFLTLGRAGQGWEVATCDPKLPKSSSSSLVIVVTRKRISKGGKTAQRSRHSNF
jgi:hypothetical protein